MARTLHADHCSSRATQREGPEWAEGQGENKDRGNELPELTRIPVPCSQVLWSTCAEDTQGGAQSPSGSRQPSSIFQAGRPETTDYMQATRSDSAGVSQESQVATLTDHILSRLLGVFVKDSLQHTCIPGQPGVCM